MPPTKKYSVKSAFFDHFEEHARQVRWATKQCGSFANWARSALRETRIREMAEQRKRREKAELRRRSVKKIKPSPFIATFGPCLWCERQPLAVDLMIGTTGTVWTVICGCDDFEYPQAATPEQVRDLWNNGKIGARRGRK